MAQAIGAETGVKVIELGTHNLPSDGKYSTFLIDNAKKIARDWRRSYSLHELLVHRAIRATTSS